MVAVVKDWKVINVSRGFGYNYIKNRRLSVCNIGILKSRRITIVFFENDCILIGDVFSGHNLFYFLLDRPLMTVAISGQVW